MFRMTSYATGGRDISTLENYIWAFVIIFYPKQHNLKFCLRELVKVAAILIMKDNFNGF